MNIEELISEQRTFFNSGKTRTVEFRKEQLQRLKKILNENETLLLDAIYTDLKKSKYDAFSSEISLIYREISFMNRNLKKWSRKQRVRTNLANFPARSYLLPEPYGVTYIAGAWNYPYQLTLIPLVDAMAAGNTAVVKPSEVAPETSHAMAKIINENFPPGYIHVVEGGAETAQEILQHKFDYIFFTGGAKIGKIVYEAAAKHLTPVTLELGGKNPAVVLPDCDIPITAKRIVWGKLYNAGQTCVAVDYVLVHSFIEQKLLEEMKKVMEQYYPKDSFTDNYMAIVNARHYDRLEKLIDQKKIYSGGILNKEKLFIGPTILHNISVEDEIMKEEIFGPILPVLRYDSPGQAMSIIQKFPKPLSVYVFGKNPHIKEKIFNELSFGGGSWNDTVMYFVNDHLPLGGVGSSGIGAYHGYEGFRTFSHYKAIMEKPTWIEFWFLKTLPYSEWKLKLLRMLFEKL